MNISFIIDVNFKQPSFNGQYDFNLTDINNESANFTTKAINTQGITTFGNQNKDNLGTLSLSHKNMSNTMELIKSKFDIIIIDTPGSIISIDGLTMLKYSDLCLYSIRANISKAEYIENVDIIQHDFHIKNIKIVLNGAHQSINYSGNFSSSQLNYSKSNKGIFKKIQRYISTYLK